MIESWLPPISVAKARDGLFELLFDRREPPLPLGSTEIPASQAIQLDPVMYEDARADFATSVHEDLESTLDSDSWRRLGQLSEAIAKRGVVPFVGAGMSAAAGLPTWSAFLRKQAIGRIDARLVKRMLKLGQFEQLAEVIRERVGHSSFDEALFVFDSSGDLPKGLVLVAAMFREAIVTTNFDDLLERSATLVGNAVKPIEGSSMWAGMAGEGRSGRERVLLKLHGHYARAAARVLLPSEYDLAYAPDGPSRRDLTHLFTSTVLVFLGCSLADDRTMAVALDAALASGEDHPWHYCFLPLGSKTTERELFLSERNIYPIWYANDSGSHEGLEACIWWLSNQLEASGSA